MSNKIENRPLSDKALVRLLQQGDEGAFQVLVRRYQKKLFSIAFGITLNREESLDIVQEVFIQVYEKIGYFKEKSSLSTWLHRITVNRCLNWKRKWIRIIKFHHTAYDENKDNLILNQDSGNRTTDRLYEEKVMGQQIDAGLKKLPEKIRTVFILRELEGLSYNDIADIMRIKIGTVKSRIYYARQKLKVCLKPLVEEDRQ